MKRILIVTAAAVVVVANAWSLIGAWHNRSEPSGGTLELTEREARLVQMPWESTAILLDLKWDVLTDTGRDRRMPDLAGTQQNWRNWALTARFRSGDPDAEQHYDSLSTALVYVVLEFEGEAWRQACHDREPETRLFVVDAGRDADRLRDRYADMDKYVITRGVARLSYQEHSQLDGTPLATPRLQGWIESVVPSQVYVPQPFSRRLEEFRHRGPPAEELPEGQPRFAVTVSWGSNYEPWVAEVRAVPVDGEESKTPQVKATDE